MTNRMLYSFFSFPFIVWSNYPNFLLVLTSLLQMLVVFSNTVHKCSPNFLVVHECLYFPEVPLNFLFILAWV